MLIHGNSFRIPLKDNSVHAAISSYPYYNLRSYPLPPTIWGGETNCQHIWDSRLHVPQPHGDNGQAGSGLEGGKGTQGQTRMGEIESAFCQLCGAWRGCFGLEPNISLHVQNAVLVSREVYRVLRKDGIFVLNYGDSYSASRNGRSAKDTKIAGNDDRTFRDKPFDVTELPAKNLCMIPQRVALALQADGWVLRSEIPWFKPNAMPSSVQDRPGTAHEHVFLFVKSKRYYFDMQAARRKQGSNSHGGNGANAGDKRRFLQGGSNGTLGQSPHQVNKTDRALRTSDFFLDSLDAYIAHLQDIRDNGGLLLDSEGMPAALVVNSESYSAAHYATFPRKLIEPMVKVTPQKVCPECGKPWQRIVKRGELVPDDPTYKPRGQNRGDGYVKNAMVPAGATQGHPNFHYEKQTTGWQPTCKCIQNRAPNLGMTGGELLELADEVAKELAPIPAIILDPFCGSGTVGAVARELGRRFIGIDLSAKYLQENALPRSEKLTSEKALGQLPLFAHRPAEE